MYNPYFMAFTRVLFAPVLSSKQVQVAYATARLGAPSMAVSTASPFVGSPAAGAFASASSPTPATPAAAPAEFGLLLRIFPPAFVQNLLGAFFGNGCLQVAPSEETAYFCITQGLGNPGGLGYIMMLFDLFKGVGLLGAAYLRRDGALYAVRKPNSLTGNVNSEWRLATLSLPQFAHLFRLLYVDGLKVAPEFLVCWVDPNFLAYL